MKFSEATGGFYPSEEDKLEAYSELPNDLVEVSAECYTKYLNNELGPSVEISNGLLIPKVDIIDYSIEARSLRDLLRNKIDKYLLPAATISDELVTEEQKTTLIQDSLVLARWPAQEGWPYIDLPILSDLCKSLLSIPVWEYPTQEVS